MNIASLFSSAGIAESRLNEIGINTLVSNELIENRCNLYAEINPESEIISGDISLKSIEKAFIDLCKEKKNRCNYGDTAMSRHECCWINESARSKKSFN